jgi:hypothetical protein
MRSSATQTSPALAGPGRLPNNDNRLDDLSRIQLFEPALKFVQDRTNKTGSPTPRPAAPPTTIGQLHTQQDNDAKSGDYPLINGKPTYPSAWERGTIARNFSIPMLRNMSNWSDQQLLQTFLGEYFLAAKLSPVAIKQFNRFKFSEGGTMLSKPGSELSNLVRDSSQGKALTATLQTRIADRAAAELQRSSTRSIDPSKLRIDIDYKDRPSWTRDAMSPMFGMLGGTDGMEVQMLKPQYDAASRRLTGSLRITVIDRFGLSNQDNDSPGQMAMWTLQHQRGYKSFENRIVYEVPLNVTVRAPQPGNGP